ncbi:hypothetical protein CAT61_08580 [Acinetobacter baumannii]|nr:hypothetical protein CAT61_08580 [Acinetobacter baumannii]
MMDVHSQLLILGVLPEHLFGIMVAERKRVDRLAPDPAHPKVSPFRPTATKRETNGSTLKKTSFFNVLERGLSKPAGNVASTQSII